MANVQKENGYTPIANKILDNIVSLPLNGTQFRIVMVVWRYTYGFSRKEHEFSETFLAKATGIHKKQIHRELADLVNYNIIQVVKEATFNSPRILKFNKDYDSWQVAKKLPVSELTGNELDVSPGSELVPSPGSELVPQDNQDLKAIFKDDDYKIRVRDPEYADIIKNFEKYIFPMTERSAEMIADWQNDFTSDIIIRAMKVAADNNARNIKYIDRVLTGWRNHGLKTLEEVEAYLQSRNKNPPPEQKKDPTKSTLDAYREATVKLE